MITRNYDDLTFDYDQKNYRELKEQISGPNRDNIVPFVGAGLSMYGPPDKRLPSWAGLLYELTTRAEKQSRLSSDQVEEIRKALQKGQFPEGLGKIFSYAGDLWVARTVEKILEIDADGLSPAAMALMTISWTIVVTTNLDRMLELAHEELERQGDKAKGSLSVFTSRNEDAFGEALSLQDASRTSLAKIHGTVEDYRSFVLTSQAYDLLLDNGIYRFYLHDLFRRSLLIIGFSLNDPDFDWAMDHVATNFRARNSPPYVVLPNKVFDDPEQEKNRNRVKYLQEHNDLRVIVYQVEDNPADDDHWSGHRGLFECISDLRTAWFQNYRNFQILGSPLALERQFVGRSSELARLDDCIFSRQVPCQIFGFGGEGKTALLAHWLDSRRDRFAEAGIKDAFIFNCHVDSPAEFFARAGQILGNLPPGMTRGEQRKAILSFAAARKPLFVFDRFEIFQKPEKDGVIGDRMLGSFLAEIVDLGCPVVLTTRLELPDFGETLDLHPLDRDEVDKLVDTILPRVLHPATLRAALDHLDGHAQSIRLFLENQQEEGHVLSYKARPVYSSRETDNKAEYTLKAIHAGLCELEDIILQVASIFRHPFTIEIVEELIRGEWPDLGIRKNDPLLRQKINALVERHLIVSSNGPVIFQLHPNIRDFYHALARDVKPLHRALVEFYRKRKAEEPVVTSEQANHYFLIAYHAACAGDWSLFDYYYQQVLMRGQEDYVCDTLGMWSETLDLTKLVFPDGHTDKAAPLHSAYYSSRYARCLKHLGYGAESSAAYDGCMIHCANEHFPKTAIYLNNYLTLELYRGNLDKASRMAAWNFAVIPWLGEENAMCNQMEHGGYSIGWLAMLKGDFDTARKLFEIAADAWQGREDQRWVFFDYYAIYFCELYLVEDQTAVHASRTLDDLLATSLEYGWKETEARCQIFLSMTERHKARQGASGASYLQSAAYRCGAAEMAIDSIFAPPVELELLLEKLCLYFEDPLLFPPDQDAGSLLKNFIDLRSNLEWDLYLADQFAFLGLEADLRGNRKQALALLEDAEECAKKQQNMLALLSPYRATSMLRKKLAKDCGISFSDLSASCQTLAETAFQSVSASDLQKAAKGSFVPQPELFQ